jgi:hypothetical protein
MAVERPSVKKTVVKEPTVRPGADILKRKNAAREAAVRKKMAEMAESSGSAKDKPEKDPKREERIKTLAYYIFEHRMSNDEARQQRRAKEYGLDENELTNDKSREILGKEFPGEDKQWTPEAEKIMRERDWKLAEKVYEQKKGEWYGIKGTGGPDKAAPTETPLDAAAPPSSDAASAAAHVDGPTTPFPDAASAAAHVDGPTTPFPDAAPGPDPSEVQGTGKYFPSPDYHYPNGYVAPGKQPEAAPKPETEQEKKDREEYEQAKKEFDENERKIAETRHRSKGRLKIIFESLGLRKRNVKDDEIKEYLGNRKGLRDRLMAAGRQHFSKPEDEQKWIEFETAYHETTLAIKSRTEEDGIRAKEAKFGNLFVGLANVSKNYREFISKKFLTDGKLTVKGFAKGMATAAVIGFAATSLLAASLPALGIVAVGSAGASAAMAWRGFGALGAGYAAKKRMEKGFVQKKEKEVQADVLKIIEAKKTKNDADWKAFIEARGSAEGGKSITGEEQDFANADARHKKYALLIGGGVFAAGHYASQFAHAHSADIKASAKGLFDRAWDKVTDIFGGGKPGVAAETVTPGYNPGGPPMVEGPKGASAVPGAGRTWGVDKLPPDYFDADGQLTPKGNAFFAKQGIEPFGSEWNANNLPPDYFDADGQLTPKGNAFFKQFNIEPFDGSQSGAGRAWGVDKLPPGLYDADGQLTPKGNDYFKKFNVYPFDGSSSGSGKGVFSPTEKYGPGLNGTEQMGHGDFSGDTAQVGKDGSIWRSTREIFMKHPDEYNYSDGQAKKAFGSFKEQGFLRRLGIRGRSFDDLSLEQKHKVWAEWRTGMELDDFTKNGGKLPKVVHEGYGVRLDDKGKLFLGTDVAPSHGAGKAAAENYAGRGGGGAGQAAAEAAPAPGAGRAAAEHHVRGGGKSGGAISDAELDRRIAELDQRGAEARARGAAAGVRGSEEVARLGSEAQALSEQAVRGATRANMGLLNMWMKDGGIGGFRPGTTAREVLEGIRGLSPGITSDQPMPPTAGDMIQRGNIVRMTQEMFQNFRPLNGRETMQQYMERMSRTNFNLFKALSIKNRL